MTPIADAATTLAAKAERMLARVSLDQPKAAEKSQRAAGLLQLASEISNEPSYRTLALAVSAAPITARDREVAANEIYSLAMRRAALGSTRTMPIGKPIALKPGWVAGNDAFGLPIQPERLQHAVALYDLALALKYDSYWDYSKGLLQEQAGDFAGAVQTFERIQDTHDSAKQHITRCLAKIAGSYDAQAALDSSLKKVSDRVQLIKHQDRGLVQKAMNLLRGVFKTHAVSPQVEPPEASNKPTDDAPINAADLDLATNMALNFAELLVDGEFHAARDLLSEELKHLRSSDLERHYLSMTRDENSDEIASDSVEICVMSSEFDMANMNASDLAWVYIAISGEEFNEAVAVIVTREHGQLRIRSIEWGRP